MAVNQLSLVREQVARNLAAGELVRAALTRPRLNLRVLLVAIDVAGLVAAWLVALMVTGPADPWTGDRLLVGSAAVTAAMLMNHGRGLYLARVCSVRSVEVARLASSMIVASTAAVIAAQMLHHPWPVTDAAVGGALGFLFGVLGRGRYGQWLKHARASGRFCRPVLIVGTGAEAGALVAMLELHPDIGMRAVGVVGSESHHGLPIPWLGPIDDTVSALEELHANSVLIAASDLTPNQLNQVTRHLTAVGAHIHLSSGLKGISSRRIRPLPLAREPLFYVEPASLSRVQRATKRLIDIVGASTLLVVFAPAVAVAATMVKLHDGGPALFTQTRVGLRGKQFRLFKLRTMIPDAEAQRVDLTIRNERTGPLFKVAHDPRRTRIGRVLERTSLDELPQLFNVLRGEMSLVGPRPALPAEVEQFSIELQARHEVLPGITGLWQVEGRENPAFDLYEQLDLYYVENWSVWLDLVILVGTLRSVLGRLIPHRPVRTPAHG